MSQESIKNHKDAFVSALAEFRKLGNELSDAAIGLVGAIDKSGVFTDSDKHEIIRFTNAFSSGNGAETPKLEASGPAAAAEDEDSPKPKKKKRVTDPDQPKRPLPLVLEYLNAEKKRIREQRAADQEPALEINELNTLARKAWEEVPDAEKKQLVANHEQRVSKYQSELSEYKAKKEAKENEDPSEPAPASPATPKDPKEEADDSSKKRKKDTSPEKKDKKRKKKSKDTKESK